MSTFIQAPEHKIDSDSLVQFLKASADELRISILRVLRSDSYNVHELCDIFELKQSALSHHLKLLSSAELVITRREGNTIFYRRNVFAHDHNMAALQNALFDSIDLCPTSAAIESGIHRVEATRVQSSLEFFHDNADKFREQQDLIASFEQYADSVEDFLKTLPLPASQSAIEIGPGEGLFLPVLSGKFSNVSAYDTSPVMLKKCKALTKNKNLNNVSLITGDTKIAVAQSTDVDCVVINMVLHHVATPADLFQDISQTLKPGGALVVTDLCHHDQAWAREACGDVWLGFEPEDLSHWAKRAGLEEGQSSFLAQRNGFRIQIRHFYKQQSNTLHSNNFLKNTEDKNP